MSSRACKAAICCSGVAAKIRRIDQLIVRRFIIDPDLLDEIIAAGETMDGMLDQLIEQIRNADQGDDGA